MAFFAKDHLSDHEYDGIREYDNPTPGWWHLIFIGTVLFSMMYFVYFHSNPNAPTPQSVLAAKQTMENKKLFGRFGNLKNDEASLLMLMKDAKMMDVAGAMYAGKCTQCHGPAGGGINGVNLTDDSYKNVKKITDIFNVLTNGAGAGAMPAWKAQMDENERVLMSAYVATLRGKNVTGRVSEGEKIDPWPTAAGAGTVGGAKDSKGS